MPEAYPLAWPDGWRRTPHRKDAKFSSGNSRLSVSKAIQRVHEELRRLGVNVRDDSIISTNLRLNMSGQPRGDQGEPGDPGAAIYWQQKDKPMRVMAIDTYKRVADNIGAIAATLEAMRAIERYGGATILDRAFTGFAALPPPTHWTTVLGVSRNATSDQVENAFRQKARKAHPDTGGSDAAMSELNAARDAALKEVA